MEEPLYCIDLPPARRRGTSAPLLAVDATAQSFVSAQDDPCTVTCEPGVQYYPNPADCGRFCQCSNGRPYNMACSGNLYFNPDLLTCDYPANANCHLQCVEE